MTIMDPMLQVYLNLGNMPNGYGTDAVKEMLPYLR